MTNRIDALNGGGGPPRGAEAVRPSGAELSRLAQDGLMRGTSVIREFTVTKPAAALCVAVGLGVFVGWIVKRI